MQADSVIKNHDGIRGFQQLVVDAVELAGVLSPPLKTQLICVLGPTFSAEVPPTIGQQKASLPAVLRMLVYARYEADRLSGLRNARQPLEKCVAFLLDRESYSQTGVPNRCH